MLLRDSTFACFQWCHPTLNGVRSSGIIRRAITCHLS